ncbi:hypothetical protein, partial [Klebsiella pneumoniae]|uniref:hypothetical protein n=1 Tax=Klebsiella pneumoniae TaxID=573 RepID=UPI001ABD24FD
EWVHVQLHQQKGMISLSPPTICNSAVRMTNQPATASQKTDEVTNKTTLSMTVDTIFSGTGFTPLQWVAMEREHS